MVQYGLPRMCHVLFFVDGLVGASWITWALPPRACQLDGNSFPEVQRPSASDCETLTWPQTHHPSELRRKLQRDHVPCHPDWSRACSRWRTRGTRVSCPTNNDQTRNSSSCDRVHVIRTCGAFFATIRWFLSSFGRVWCFNQVHQEQIVAGMTTQHSPSVQEQVTVQENSELQVVERIQEQIVEPTEMLRSICKLLVCSKTSSTKGNVGLTNVYKNSSVTKKLRVLEKGGVVLPHELQWILSLLSRTHLSLVWQVSLLFLASELDLAVDWYLRYGRPPMSWSTFCRIWNSRVCRCEAEEAVRSWQVICCTRLSGAWPQWRLPLKVDGQIPSRPFSCCTLHGCLLSIHFLLSMSLLHPCATNDFDSMAASFFQEILEVQILEHIQKEMLNPLMCWHLQWFMLRPINNYFLSLNPSLLTSTSFTDLVYAQFSSSVVTASAPQIFGSLPPF